MTKGLSAALFAFAFWTTNAQLSIKTTCNQSSGWMADGWGSYTIVAKNTTKDTITLTSWGLDWKGEKENGHDLNIQLGPDAEWKKTEIGHLSQATVTNFGKKTPQMRGTIHAKIGNKEKEFPIRLDIPVSHLPEESKTVQAGNVGISLMQSRYSSFQHLDNTLRWMNQAYNAMSDLIGGTPYEGKRIILKESPEHPYWAYAGQEIILNTKFVESTLQDFDKGLLSFGWVHEMGHDFDNGIGEWYIWSGPAAEFQANFKLCYAVEHMEDQSFFLAQTVKVPNYPLVKKAQWLKGPDFADKTFLFFGDSYLADSSRSWETLRSDEMHSFFMRIERTYGWDVFKQWHRTYAQLKSKGFSPPEKKEDKINLIAAILNKTSKVDLMPLFQEWRFPVSREAVEKMESTYHLEEVLP